MGSIADLKKLTKNSTSKFREKVKEETSSGFDKDDSHAWKPFLNKEKGVGQAVIRPLPAPEGEDFPWVKRHEHGFKGPSGQWYIEKCPTSIGKECPACEFNGRLYNSGVESDKAIVSRQKRKTNYYSNILVIEDPANHENDGKVFLYRYGKQIYDIIMGALNPKFDDVKSINAFDPWEGADLVLRAVKDDAGFWSYEEHSAFKEPSPIGTDKEIQALWSQCQSLQVLLEEDKAFKSYEQLAARLHKVMGDQSDSGVPVLTSGATSPKTEAKAQASVRPAQEESKPAAKDEPRDRDEPEGSGTSPDPVAEDSPEDEDDDMAFFEKLANG